MREWVTFVAGRAGAVEVVGRRRAAAGGAVLAHAGRARVLRRVAVGRCARRACQYNARPQR